MIILKYYLFIYWNNAVVLLHAAYQLRVTHGLAVHVQQRQAVPFDGDATCQADPHHHHGHIKARED